MGWLAVVYVILIVIGAIALLIFMGYLTRAIVLKKETPSKDVLQPLAGALVGLLGVAGALLQLNETAHRERLQQERAQENVTAAVRAEMKSIMTIVSDALIAEQFAFRFARPSSTCLWADAARTEDYLTVYKALSSQFGLIQAAGSKDAAPAIDRVVNFYSYFKASRDATVPLRPASGVPDDATVRQVSKSVMLLLERMYASGEEFLGGNDKQFAKTRLVLQAFRAAERKHDQLKNEELAAIWEKDPAFATIPGSLCRK